MDLTSLHKIPEKYKGIKYIEQVDVIWFVDKPPNYFFEIEDKGTMRDALHRMYQALVLDAKFFVVSPVGNRLKFEKYINSEPYASVKDKYQFKSYEDLVKFFEVAINYHELRKGFLGI